MAAENLKDVRRLLKEFLWKSFNTDQMNFIARETDSRFELSKVSGFGHHVAVTRQVAADVIVDYFQSEEQLLTFFAMCLSMEGKNASGGQIRFISPDAILKKLKEKQWLYDGNAGRFFKNQKESKTSDWGFFQEGKEYDLVFASIDVVGSSALARTNVPADVEFTLTRLRSYIQEHIEHGNGRLWYWHGDGGVAAYYGENAAARAVIAGIGIISYLPLFNITKNDLRPENDVAVRIGIHSGVATYRSDTEKIHSPDIKHAEEVEKNWAESNTIAATERVVGVLSSEIRRVFSTSGDFEGHRIFTYRPA